SINHNQAIVNIPAPQDGELARLNAELNKTYIPYGKSGQAAQNRQCEQDANALKASPGVLAARSAAKCSTFYCPSDWDLVDAVKTGKCKLDDVKAEDLPEEYRKLSLAERRARVAEAAGRREDVR